MNGNSDRAISHNICTKSEDNSLISKYRGCLLSALLGDCLGAPYEQDYWDDLPSPTQIDSYIIQLLKGDLKVPVKQYTDDTAMTFSVCNSLFSQQAFQPSDMAQHFVREYMSEPGRGYGVNVGDVFSALRKQQCQTPYGPAQLQFNGQGSYGNGGAMRVAPVALFCVHNVSVLLRTAKDQARITHAHASGYNGAVLQCLVVYLALQYNPVTNPLDCAAFLSELESLLAPALQDVEQSSEDVPLYISCLRRVADLTSRDLDQLPRHVIVDLLGHDVSAQRSVPTAIFCFLRQVKLENSRDAGNSEMGAVLETISFAISLGGDTDTVASMAGAVAGAYWGDSVVPGAISRHCEASDKAVTHAENLYHLVHP